MKTHERYGGKRLLYVLIIIVLLGGYIYWAMSRPLASIPPTTHTNSLQAQASASKLVWPAQGQSAVGIVGSSVLETHGNQVPVPTASTAKLITALVVLQKKPLQLGEQGPLITLSADDVAIYNNYAAQDGSLVRVQAGEQISEYQMLQTMLLPSANNMADSLAIWAFGSLKDYASAANQDLESVGLVETHVGSDASGLAPSTTSTARDLTRIGERVMDNPVLAQIVGQPAASGIPIAGNIKNVNILLGSDNIIGIKTGNSDQAGGVFVSASRVNVNDKPVTIVTALAGSPTLFQAMKDSVPLITSAQANFKPVTVVANDAAVGSYQLPWGGSVSAVAGKDLALSAWGGSTISAQAQLQRISADSRAGQTVGSIKIPGSATSEQVNVAAKLQSAPSKPSNLWRLLHPLR